MARLSARALAMCAIATVMETWHAHDARAQCELAMLTASDAAVSDGLGFSVAIDGEYAIFGARQDDDNGLDAGAAYIFRYDNASSMWVEHAKLLAGDGLAGDGFGVQVAISGDLAVIGAHGDDDNGDQAGAAYIFRRDPQTSIWAEQAKLLASNGGAEHHFGRAVSIHQDAALVGAPQNGGGSQTGLPGAAYVFRFNPRRLSWDEQAMLLAPDGAPNDRFGEQVALSESAAIVGANADDSSGSAHIFRFDAQSETWSHETKLLPSDNDYALFGASVAIEGDVAVVGAFSYAVYPPAITAYVFRNDPNSDQWMQEIRLTGDWAYLMIPPAIMNWVDLKGGMVLFADARDQNDGLQIGAVNLYAYDAEARAWNQHAKLLAADGCVNGGFAQSAAFSGDTIMVGAPAADHAGFNAGTVYAYHLAGDDCNDNGLCDSADLVNGVSQDVNGNNAPDECDADITGDGDVNVDDLLAVINAWGPCPPPCPADTDGNGLVDVDDLLMVINNWG